MMMDQLVWLHGIMGVIFKRQHCGEVHQNMFWTLLNKSPLEVIFIYLFGFVICLIRYFVNRFGRLIHLDSNKDK